MEEKAPEVKELELVERLSQEVLDQQVELIKQRAETKALELELSLAKETAKDLRELYKSHLAKFSMGIPYFSLVIDDHLQSKIYESLEDAEEVVNEARRNNQTVFIQVLYIVRNEKL